MASPDSLQHPQPRRSFQPLPYEASSSQSSSKRDHPTAPSHSFDATRSPSSSPVQHTSEAAISPKRFKVEPIETSTRTNRKPDGSDGSHSASMSSSDSSTSSKTPARRRFAVEPVEHTSSSHRKTASIKIQENKPPPQQSTSRPGRRKFKVELIETASRSRKAGDPAPADLLLKRKNSAPSPRALSFDLGSTRPHQMRAASNPAMPLSTLLKPSPNRQGSMHPHYNSRAPSRSHSYRVPDLEAIESSESDRSGANSPTRKGSYQDKTRMRESVDDRFSGYLLALAARAAEKQLREQEAALFPSTDSHEPIAHYVDSEESEEAESETQPSMSMDIDSAKHKYRKASDDDGLALREMQRHGEKNAASKMPPSLTGQQRKKTGAFNVEFDSDAEQDAWIQRPAPKNIIGGHQKDPDLKQMRKAASPPMLGGDMEFPRCPSPDHARFDVTQGSEYLRNSMCYLTNQEQGGDLKLWDGKSNRMALQRTVVSASRIPQSQKDASKQPKKPQGLWGGHCNVGDAKMFAQPIGLVTPKASPTLERDDPFAQLTHTVSAPSAPSSTPSCAHTGAAAQIALRSSKLPPSPPASNSSHTTPRDAATEARLAAEFPDSFVTQVYNYLSLGFPALARKFDDELSKISGVPVAELRRDDKLAEQRGYIRLGADEVCVGVRRAEAAPDTDADAPPADAADADADDDEVEVSETMCRRWLALRLYCREWGRQMGVADPTADTSKLDPRRAWGLPARKGSWGN